MAETIDNGVAAGASCLLTAILDVGHLIQMRVDVLGHLVEVAPFLTEFWGLVSLLQEVTVFPLDVICRPVLVIVARDKSSALGLNNRGLTLTDRSLAFAGATNDAQGQNYRADYNYDFFHDAPQFLN